MNLGLNLKLLPRIVLAFAMATIAACSEKSSSQTNRLPVYPASGKLLLRGQPIAGARIILTATRNTRTRTGYPDPHATTREDGTFVLSTYSTDDGAPEGEYLLTFSMPRGKRVATSVMHEKPGPRTPKVVIPNHPVEVPPIDLP